MRTHSYGNIAYIYILYILYTILYTEELLKAKELLNDFSQQEGEIPDVCNQSHHFWSEPLFEPYQTDLVTLWIRDRLKTMIHSLLFHSKLPKDLSGSLWWSLNIWSKSVKYHR